MDFNWITVGIVFLLVLVLVVFLIRRNRKDEQDYEKFLNENDIPIEKEEDEANNY